MAKLTNVILALLAVAVLCAPAPSIAGARAVLQEDGSDPAAAAANSATTTDGGELSVTDTPAPHIKTRASAASAPAADLPQAAVIGRAYKQSERAAKASLAAAEAVKLVDADDDDPSPRSRSIVPAAVCGANSLVQTSYTADCRIIVTFKNSNGQVLFTGTCSAFKIGSRFLGTAGQCVYQKQYGGWATFIDVYCTGRNTCKSTNTRTTTGTNMITTPDWAGSASKLYDMAVVRTAGFLPGSNYAVGQAPRSTTLNVEVTGYPGQNNAFYCGSTYASGCIQYSSKGTLFTFGSGWYESTNLDTCPGNAGGRVMNRGANHVTAVMSAHILSPCTNIFTPQINRANVNANSCQATSGGASLYCLMAKLPA